MENADFAQPKSSYKNLKVYQKAEAIYDLTFYFIENYLQKGDRTIDQMKQAARSGKQNIAEGRVDGTVSTEMELKLYGVAQGSFHELQADFEDFLRTRGLAIWNSNHPRYARLVNMCREHNDTVYYRQLLPKMNVEELCNLLLTLIHQTQAMLAKLMELVKGDFLNHGGIKEQMYKARVISRQNKL